MTRRDLTLKWIAYLVGLAVVTVFNYNVFNFNNRGLFFNCNFFVCLNRFQ